MMDKLLSKEDVYAAIANVEAGEKKIAQQAKDGSKFTAMQLPMESELTRIVRKLGDIMVLKYPKEFDAHRMQEFANVRAKHGGVRIIAIPDDFTLEPLLNEAAIDKLLKIGILQEGVDYEIEKDGIIDPTGVTISKDFRDLSYLCRPPMWGNFKTGKFSEGCSARGKLFDMTTGKQIRYCFAFDERTGDWQAHDCRVNADGKEEILLTDDRREVKTVSGNGRIKFFQNDDAPPQNKRSVDCGTIKEPSGFYSMIARLEELGEEANRWLMSPSTLARLYRSKTIHQPTLCGYEVEVINMKDNHIVLMSQKGEQAFADLDWPDASIVGKTVDDVRREFGLSPMGGTDGSRIITPPDDGEPIIIGD